MFGFQSTLFGYSVPLATTVHCHCDRSVLQDQSERRSVTASHCGAHMSDPDGRGRSTNHSNRQSCTSSSAASQRVRLRGVGAQPRARLLSFKFAEQSPEDMMHHARRLQGAQNEGRGGSSRRWHGLAGPGYQYSGSSVASSSNSSSVSSCSSSSSSSS
eukprot:6195400-Pleurochrysis_carterae.AAC.2